MTFNELPSEWKEIARDEYLRLTNLSEEEFARSDGRRPIKYRRNSKFITENLLCIDTFEIEYDEETKTESLVW